METALKAQTRDGRGSRVAGRLRRSGQVPAVVYGLGSESQAVEVPARDLNAILHSETGANTLIKLQVGKDEQLALVRQIQRHPVRNELLHVDFVRVRTDVAVEAEVQLQLTGTPEGVRTGGVLEQILFTLTVEAKPQDIPTGLEIDVSALEIGQGVHVNQIPLPPGVVVLDEADQLAAHVTAPRVEEEPVVAEGELAEGEVPEGEAPTEGEGAPAEGGGAEGESASSE